MKKLSTTIIIFFLILGCGKNSRISEIDGYVEKINSRKDLSESLTEYETEINGEDFSGGFDIYELSDSSKKVYRIIANIALSNDSLYDYEFYYKMDTLVYARILGYAQKPFDQNSLDTIINSKYYYDRNDLLKQIDLKTENMDGETVRQLSEFYIVYGNQTE